VNCPKCGNSLDVTHSYRAGVGVGTQRQECSKCNCVLTAVTFVIVMNVDPDYGQGAAKIAKKLAKTKIPVFIKDKLASI
jgi:hypothetical protein